jgi:hypothetical protein
MRRKLVYITLRPFLLFGGLFLCLLFRHARIVACAVGQSIKGGFQTDPLPFFRSPCGSKRTLI